MREVDENVSADGRVSPTIIRRSNLSYPVDDGGAAPNFRQSWNIPPTGDMLVAIRAGQKERRADFRSDALGSHPVLVEGRQGRRDAQRAREY